MTAAGIALVTGSFLLGSVPFGYLLGRWRGVDVRGVGSGNIGATNVMRAAGRGAGLVTLLLDLAKGAAGPMLAVSAGFPPALAATAGLAGVLGHCFSPFLRWRGGKGVATLIGSFAALDASAAAVAVAAFAVVLVLCRYVAVASLALALTLAGAVAVRHGAGDPRSAAALIALAVVAWRHRDNWSRLRRGSEHRVLSGSQPAGRANG